MEGNLVSVGTRHSGECARRWKHLDNHKQRRKESTMRNSARRLLRMGTGWVLVWTALVAIPYLVRYLEGVPIGRRVSGSCRELVEEPVTRTPPHSEPIVPY